MKNKTVLKTVKNSLCVSCGICKYICKFGAINMERNIFGEVVPKINNVKCRKCGLCLKYCPNSPEKFKEESNKVTAYEEPHTYGLQNSKYYVAWDPNKKQRMKSCSGGVTTKLACFMLETGQINGVIHVERLWGKKGDLHYGARISKTTEEIQEHVSSAYQPIDFSNILLELEENKTYFMTGTPCVIRGIKYLIKDNKYLKNINIITCALICSHNTNSQIIDYLTEINNITKNDKEWKVNIRAKDESIPDANNYKNHIYNKDGKDLLNKNRFDSGWTHIWRTYYFAMGACLKCSDFWGYEADISIKDAWGEWASDPLGKSIVIIRNPNIEKQFTNSSIIYEALDWKTIKDHQYATSFFKQAQSHYKNFKSIFSKSNRKNCLLKYLIISKSSNFLYKFFGYKITKFVMIFIEWIANRSEKL